MALPSGGSPALSGTDATASTSSGATNLFANDFSCRGIKLICTSASANALDAQIRWQSGAAQTLQLAAGESQEFYGSLNEPIEGVFVEGDGGDATYQLWIIAQ